MNLVWVSILIISSPSNFGFKIALKRSGKRKKVTDTRANQQKLIKEMKIKVGILKIIRYT